jgi:hypothetical protein
VAADEPEAEQDPVERLLDLCVFAPLGFVTDAGRVIPELAQRGRQQATMARMVGEFAVTWGSSKVHDVVAQAQEHTVDVLQRLGVASPEPDPAQGAPVVDTDPEPSVPEPSSPVDEVVREEPSAVDEPLVVELVDDVWLVDEGSSVTSSDPAADPAEAAALAIPEYDNLSASQVVPRLDGLTPAELDAVLRYERGHRHRKTILNRIAQLQDGMG